MLPKIHAVRDEKTGRFLDFSQCPKIGFFSENPIELLGTFTAMPEKR